MNKSRNRFNLISSKEWLPFQKSWFIHSDDTAMFRSNVRFFTKSDEGINNVFVDGLTKSKSDLVMNEEGINKVSLTSKNISFAYLDLRKDLEKIHNSKLVAKNFLISSSHLFGTCSPNIEPLNGVIDKDFKVKNTDNLYVIDASSLPLPTSYNPQLAIMVIAKSAINYLLDN